jgi:hypothetical protein
MKNVWLNGIESAEKCINIRDKLTEAAKQKPGKGCYSETETSCEQRSEEP